MINRYLNPLRRRRGLTIVVTTLILLTFAVLLALTATAYTNGVTRAQMNSAGQENIRFYKNHIWVDALDNGTDRTVVAFKLHSLGGKSIAVVLIDIRSWEVDWSTVYYHAVNETSEGPLLYMDLNYFPWASLAGSSVMIDGYNYTQATGNVAVKSGETIILYIRASEFIYKDNIGMPVSIAVGTTNANFFTECVAESAK
jgi:type II secretory pathway pseudopilin PulG